jgi:tetratricopeptide (TPR) repeat protein
MSELYNLIFFPTVKPGIDESEVKALISLKLKIDKAKVDGWFESGKPTLLLKDVAPDVADRYMQVILDCGGNCNMQPSGSDGKGSLSLIPKPANVELFFCPSCEYEEELEPGQTYEQCPKCDLVLAKWAERQEEERKKEEIRRRLLRDARFQDDAASDDQRKRDELAELKRLEADLMKELGIKPPSKLWQIFSQRPVSISTSIGILLVTLSSVISFLVSEHLDSKQAAEIAMAPPGEEIQAVAPAIVDAVGLQISGNQAMVEELAAATQLLTGGASVNPAVLTKAAEQMMKGAGNADFLNQVNSSSVLKSTTPGGLGEPAPVAVNRSTLGGVQGLPGIEEITDEALLRTRPGELTHGHENVVSVLSSQLQLPDPQNPNGADILVDKIDRLDGSMVVGLMKSLSQDLEWDQFLLSQVEAYLLNGQPGQARDLTEAIENPSVKLEAQTREIEALVMGNADADLKLSLARVSVELSNIESLDLRARFWLRIAMILDIASVPNQPSDLLSRVENMARDADEPGDRAAILARLAGAKLESDRGQAEGLFRRAMQEAGRSGSVIKRIEAFTHIAQRLYDARNLTLASEILSEAQVVVATELTTHDRAIALMDIAVAQLYMGDLTGMEQTLRNAASGEARQKLLAQLAAWSIDEGEHYKAQALIEQMSDRAAAYRLAIRLIARVIHKGDEQKGRALLSEYSPRPSDIKDKSERALILSQFARLHLRLRQPDKAERLFKEALALSDDMTGRKAAVTRGMIALDQARGLWVKQAREAIEVIGESIVVEPIGSEITAAERVIKHLLPKAISDQLK